MDVKFEIGTINNSEGKGGTRKYVRLQQERSVTADELAAAIEHECTLSRADIKAVFEALRYHVVDELRSGKRLHIPRLGYFSLSAALAGSDSGKKITGKDVYLRGINFQPEDSLMREVGYDLRFSRAKYISQSVPYTADELWSKVSAYLSSHHYITCRIMRSEFGLSDRMARRWLTTFVEQGKLMKGGTRHMGVYYNGPTPTPPPSRGGRNYHRR